MNEESKSKPVALVTGVGKSTGLGFEICRQMAAQGFTVWLTSRDRDTADDLASRLREQALDVRACALDITDAGSVSACHDSVRDTHGRLDVLVNNAAASAHYGETVAGADLAAARQVFDASFFGTWAVIEAFLPLLRKSRGARIVNVSSGAGSHGDKMFGLETGNAMGPSYSSAKAAINALTSSLARELSGTPILVNAVCPGLTATFPGAETIGARPVAEGARGIVWAATLPAGGPSGGFFRDSEPLPW